MIISLLGESDIITTVRILEERLGKGAADPSPPASSRSGGTGAVRSRGPEQAKWLLGGKGETSCFSSNVAPPPIQSRRGTSRNE
ncbi:MAG: hypothetical protein A2V83_03975 [Nitrospirae bacterium RBG_16_64_22]|nr:MAG: hypothetical protein A2V83_03975 [Nitrospirae bacterium RBG_16_64_22]